MDDAARAKSTMSKHAQKELEILALIDQVSNDINRFRGFDAYKSCSSCLEF